jgi:hypothetical protein
MTARAARVLAVALAATAVAAAACHHRKAEPSAGAERTAREDSTSDTLRGTLRATGTQPFPRLTLFLADSSRAVTLRGPAELANVAGLELEVLGTRSGDAFAVRRFTVVASDGLAATDGRLVASGDTLVLVTADGVRHPLVHPSPTLRAHVGHRAWVAGPLDAEPVRYGIID